MTKDEVLKLALEALEAGDWYIKQLELLVYASDDDGTHENRAKVQTAITFIKEALEQPAYRAVKTFHEGKPVYVAQPEQERNFCARCGKRAGDYIHTCTPPQEKNT